MKKFILIITFTLFSLNSFANKIDDKVLNEIYTTIYNNFLEPVSMEKITNEGLKSLNDLDKKILVSNSPERYYLYYNNQVKKVFSKPKDIQNINDWIELNFHITKTAMDLSENISLRDFELADIMAKRVLYSLDKYSKYLSEYDYDENKGENAIYTLYSDRIIDDILYLKVRIFNKQTSVQIQKSIEDNPNIKGIILDLRGNSGGILNEALKVADFFLDNQIIAYTANRNKENIHYYTSKDGEIYSGPLVIITDGETASAAEVLAASLQSQSRAKIIGSQTFGKGTIQNITEVSNGGKLVLTTEQFFTPDDKPINNVGVTPDICLAQKQEICHKENALRNENYLNEALSLIKNEY